MPLTIYECSHFPTVLPALDLVIRASSRYKMVHYCLILHLGDLSGLICISLITNLFYKLVYYWYFLLCIVCLCTLLLLAEVYLATLLLPRSLMD